MGYNESLANHVRAYLSEEDGLIVTEKSMFGGLAFLVNDKMCINISADRLMLRFDPVLTEELSNKKGFVPMIMRGREMKGYCYVEEQGFSQKEDFEFWMKICLQYNESAKSSKGI